MKSRQFDNDDIKNKQSTPRIVSNILAYAMYTKYYPHPLLPTKAYIQAPTHFLEKEDGYFFDGRREIKKKR